MENLTWTKVAVAAAAFTANVAAGTYAVAEIVESGKEEAVEEARQLILDERSRAEERFALRRDVAVLETKLDIVIHQQAELKQLIRTLDKHQ